MENFDYQKAYEILVEMTNWALQVRQKNIVVNTILEDLRNNPNPSTEDLIMKAAEARPHYMTWKELKRMYADARKEFAPFIDENNGRTVENLDLLIFEYGENL